MWNQCLIMISTLKYWPGYHIAWIQKKRYHLNLKMILKCRIPPRMYTTQRVMCTLSQANIDFIAVLDITTFYFRICFDKDLQIEQSSCSLHFC